MTSRLDRLPDDRRREIAKDLQHILDLDRDALKGYEAAVRNLSDEAAHHQAAEIREEHERHIQDIESMMQKLGEHPRERSEATSGFKDAVLQAEKDDRQLLEAIRNEEARIQREYDQYAARDYPTVLDRLMKRHAEDEHGHHDWASNILRGGGI